MYKRYWNYLLARRDFARRGRRKFHRTRNGHALRYRDRTVYAIWSCLCSSRGWPLSASEMVSSKSWEYLFLQKRNYWISPRKEREGFFLRGKIIFHSIKHSRFISLMHVK